MKIWEVNRSADVYEWEVAKETPGLYITVQHYRIRKNSEYYPGKKNPNVFLDRKEAYREAVRRVNANIEELRNKIIHLELDETND